MFDLIKDDYFLNGLWYDNIRITITEMLLKVLKPSWLLQVKTNKVEIKIILVPLYTTRIAVI